MEKSKKMVAIVGMCGVGKSVASEILEDLGYKKVYFGGVNINKLKEANLEINPKNEKMMREKLRAEYGMGAFASILLPTILEYQKTNDVVLDGLYSFDELKILREALGDTLKLIAVVSDRELRYERLSKREIRPLTKEEAIKRDIAEIENIAKGGPIAMADFYINNNYDELTYKTNLLEIIDKI